ncbi:MAG: metal-dependent phosphohydrolase [Sphingobacteriaceae bacterium]|nr:metal-dependent phosphohydrolase [Cytophagaceae bacterium]
MTSLPTEPNPDLEIRPTLPAPDPAPGLPTDLVEDQLAKLKKKEKKKDKKKKRSKGVETLFRTSLASHLQLSEMADTKANLMIQINAILISITMTGYIRQINVSDVFFWPSILLLTNCLVTIIVSLLVTNPTLSMKLKSDPAPTNRKIDLLFFNDYVHLSRSDFRKSLQDLIANDEQLYASLIDNIYSQGKVLSRKYRRLKFAYSFFTIGFSTAVLFAIAMLLFGR